MKFGYPLLEKLNTVIATLKPTEMSLLFYLVQNQDNSTGKVAGVHHTEVTVATGMVKQSFYSALAALESKGIIESHRHKNGSYYTITVKDNAFPDRESLERGYIDLQKKVFYSEEFKQLKAPEKYLVLYFCKRTHEKHGSFCIYPKNLYHNLTELLGVTERVVRSYLHNIRKFFSIGIKSGKYYITYLHSVFKDKIAKPERLVRDEGCIREVVHKLKIRNTNNEEITQTAELLHQYNIIAAQNKKDLKREIFNVISEIISGVLQKNRNLQYKLINKLLNERLRSKSEENQHNDYQNSYSLDEKFVKMQNKQLENWKKGLA